MKLTEIKYGTMAYIVSKNNNVLMLKKGVRKDDPNSGYFTLPGGKLKGFEKGLSYPRGRLESVMREIEEETNIRPLNPVLRGVILFDNRDRSFDNWPKPTHFYVYIYSAIKFRGRARKSDEGIPYTIPLEKVKEVPSNPGDKKMYEWLADGRNFVGVIKHKGNEIDEEGTMVDFF